MKTKDAQRAVAFAAVVIGCLIAMTSSAFACGSWKGKLIVTGNGTFVGTGRSVSVGSGLGMYRCANVPQEIDARIAPLPSMGTVTVTVEPATGTCTNQLGAGTYTVNLVHEAVRAELNIQDCMNGVITGGGTTGSGNGYPIGHIVVDSTGNGVAKDLLAVGPADTGKSILCVSSPLGDQNNQVQLGFI